MTERIAILGSQILAGQDWLDNHAVIVAGDEIAEIRPADEVPNGMARHVLAGGRLVPGFVDVQVNGGGDALLNDAPTLDTVRIMAAAHRGFGTTAMLPTLISEDLDVIAAAIAAVDQAIVAGVPGVAGIHIEGPVLNPDKAGIHDLHKFRRLDPAAISVMCGLRHGKTLITLAPELCEPQQLAALTKAGAIISAGHSMATYEQAVAAFAAGVKGVTHLFNAMSALNSREPGLVGAALGRDGPIAGLIVDGRHVHPATMHLAWRLLGNDRIALVTDAMSTVGGLSRSFRFNDVEIRVEGDSCLAPDGTLAGSNLSMAAAVHNSLNMIGVSLADACIMASLTPARLMGLDHRIGRIAPGLQADFVHLGDDLQPTATWIAGQHEAICW